MLCRAQDSQLLVIDMQERLLSAMPEEPRTLVLTNTAMLLDAAGLLEIPVLHTEQYPKGLGPTHDTLRSHFADQPALEKTCFSCCGAPGFEPRLRDAGRQIIICGIEAHVCVLQTAMQLHEKGFAVFVVADAVCSRSKHHYKNALARLAQAGISITNSESVLFEWMRDAKHPHFKSISKLIR